ncbi:MAG: hypothetical protein RSA51_09335, partial [Niameybacter sp.]
MANMQVPVTWTRYKEASKYIGTAQLNLTAFKAGNTITGTWGTIGFNGSPVNFYEGTGYPQEDGTAYKTLNMQYAVAADGVSKGKVVSDNKYVWFDIPQNFSQYMDIALVPATSYTIEANDAAVKNFGPTATNSYYGDWSMNPTVALTYEITAETPTNLRQRGNKIYEDIYVDFDLLSGNMTEYSVVVGDSTVMADTITGKSIRIPTGKFLDKSKTVKVNLKSKIAFNGTTYYSNQVTLTLGGLIELVAVKPTNLRLVGAVKCIEEAMPFAFDTTDTQYSKWDFEVWQDGIKVHAKQLTTTPYSVPAYTLNSTNSISVRVRTIKSVNGYTSTTDYVSLNVSGLTSIAPSIKDFTIDQDNADYAVTIIPNVSGATSYEWVVGDAYGEDYITGQGLTIPANTMSKGNNDITLIAAAMTSTGGYVYSKKIKVFALRHDEPEIYALEPADLDINVTNNVPVTFTTNEFVDSWELEVAGIKVTGTTARKHIVTPNIFIKGTNTLRLTAVYRSSRKVSKTVTFNGYGKPSTPKLAGTEVENSSRPVFTWSIPTTTDSDEQVAYHIIIKKGNVVVEDKTVTSISKRHQTIATLGNNTAYIAYLTIKNKYNIWSDVGTRKFTTSFGDNLPDIDLELYENNGSVLITPILSDVTPDFSDVVIFRKEKNEWVLLADNINYDESVIDYSLKKDTEVSYKV